MSILFSPIGESDPIRYCYDGPMLHILRHYKDINNCYLFLTSKMIKNKEKYEEAIRQLEKQENRIIERNYIETSIEAANDYDIFYEPFLMALNKIRKEYENELIYLNLSSGTPQMGGTLALISCSDTINNILAIQVSRPNENVKKGNSAVDINYDIESEIYCNSDNSNSENRCKEVKSIMHINNNALKKVEAFIQNYNYDSALEIYNKSPRYNKKVSNLIKHLKYRQELDIDKATECLKDYGDNVQVFFKNRITKKNRENQILEYFLLLNNLYQSKKLNDFIIRFFSYFEELQKEIIKKLFDYSVEEKFCKKVNNKYIVSDDLIDSYSEDLYVNIQERFKNDFKGNYLNIEILNVIMKYEIAARNNRDFNKYLEILDKVEELKRYRNRAAHELKIVSKEELNQVYDIEKLLNELKNILKEIYDIDSRYFSLYNNINKIIKKEMGI